MSPKQKLSRALWLAFEASGARGLGHFHAGVANKLTEADLIAHYEPTTRKDGTMVVNTDYVCGRMVKTDFEVTPEGELTINPEEPSGAYQSWAYTYPTAAELIAATEDSLAKEGA